MSLRRALYIAGGLAGLTFGYIALGVNKVCEEVGINEHSQHK